MKVQKKKHHIKDAKQKSPFSIKKPRRNMKNIKAVYNTTN